MRLPICFGMALKTRDKCKQVAERLNGKDHCFVLGKGYGEPVAMEGALKIKEMCYLHAEGYSGGALKHGPFALIESDENGKLGATPIIMLIFDDDHAHHMRTAAEEVKARGADVIIITDKKSLAEGLDKDPLVIPSNGPLTALGAVLPIQLIAFELAMLRRFMLLLSYLELSLWCITANTGESIQILHATSRRLSPWTKLAYQLLIRNCFYI